MLQSATTTASCCQAPVYCHSHYKKFWLKKMEASHSQIQDCKVSGLPMNYRPRGFMSVAGSSKKHVEEKNGNKSGYLLERDMNENENKESSDGLSSADEKFFCSSPSSCRISEEESQAPLRNGVSRMCAVCKAVKTPLWRNGPLGPKSLCNACGIRYKKLRKRPSSPALSPSRSERRKKEDTNPRSTRKKLKISPLGTSDGERERTDLTERERERDRISSESTAVIRYQDMERIRRGLLRYGKMGSVAKDEQEGALLLMALSCGVASC